MVTEKVERYVRLHLLLVDGTTPILREILLKASKKDIDTFLGLFKPDIELNRSNLFSTAYKQLFPDNGITNINAWDVSLLTFVLLHCCTQEGKLDSLKKSIHSFLSKEASENKFRDIKAFLEIKKATLQQMRDHALITSEQFESIYNGDINPKKPETWDVQLLACVSLKLCVGKKRQSVLNAMKNFVIREVTLFNKTLNLQAYLKFHRTTIEDLRDQTQITDSQFDQLFPPNGVSDINNWDDSVLRVIAVNLTSSFDDDTVEELKTVRSMRSELLAHAESAEMNEITFVKNWRLLSQAISTIVREVPALKSKVRNKIDDLESGPLDLKSSIDILKEFYIAATAEKEDISDVLNSVQAMALAHIDTNERVQRMELDFQDVKKLMLEVKDRLPDNAFTSTVEIRCVDVLLIIKGTNAIAVAKAESVIREAMEKETDEDSKLNRAVQALKDFLKRDGTIIFEIKRGSIILSMKCRSLQGLYNCLVIEEDEEMLNLLLEFDTALQEITGEDMTVSLTVPQYSLQVIQDIIQEHIPNTDEHTRTVKIQLKPTSLEGLEKIVYMFDNGEVTKQLHTLSGEVSKQVEENITIAAELPIEQIKEAMDNAVTQLLATETDCTAKRSDDKEEDPKNQNKQHTFVSANVDGSEVYYDYVCAPCEGDSKTNEAVRVCVECGCYLCVDCIKNHNKFKSMQRHKIIDINDDSIKLINSKATLTAMCHCHEGQVVDLYCGTHDVVGCAKCIVVGHRTCEGIESITDIAMDVGKSEELESVVIVAAKVKSDITRFRDEHIDNLSQLYDDKNTILKDIKATREQIDWHLDVIEKRTRDKLEARVSMYEAYITATIKQLEDQLLRLEKINVSNVHSTDVNDAQLFVHMKQIKLIETEVSKSGTRVNLKRSFNVGITDSIFNIQSLGEFKDHELSLNAKVDLETETDEFECEINGSCLLADGTVVLSDENNRKLKRLDAKSYAILTECELTCRPFSICTVGPYEIAILLFDVNEIQFAVADKPDIKLTNSFDTCLNGRGISFLDDKLFFCYGNTNDPTDVCDGRINVYSKDGTLLYHLILTEAGNDIYLSRPFSFAVNDDTKRINIADRDTGIITMDSDGIVHGMFCDAAFKYPVGVCVFDDDALIVCDYETNNVYMINTNMKTKELLLKESDGIKKPNTVLFDKRSSRLIIAMEGCNQISVYNVTTVCTLRNSKHI